MEIQSEFAKLKIFCWSWNNVPKSLILGLGIGLKLHKHYHPIISPLLRGWLGLGLGIGLGPVPGQTKDIEPGTWQIGVVTRVDDLLMKDDAFL